MKVHYLIFLSVFFVGCGVNSIEDPVKRVKEPLPHVSNSISSTVTPLKEIKKADEIISNSLNLSIGSSNIAQGTAIVTIQSTLFSQNDTNSSNGLASSAVFYDNHTLRVLESGTIEEGTITLTQGKHIIQVCTNEQREKCSEEEIIIVADTIDTSLYTKLPLEEKSYGLSNDGVNIIYGTDSGLIYTLNISTKESTLLAELQERVSGLFYTPTTLFYSTIPDGTINSFTLVDKVKNTLASTPFPDGLDYFNGRLYSVTNDRSGVLSLFDLNGKNLGSLNTKIDDIVGISHSNKFLYILSEDGDIYQTNAGTGKSSKVFSNAGLFEQGNSINGLEAITILNNRIYVSYINDNSLYLININLANYE